MKHATRSDKTYEAIRNLQDFATYGNLSGTTTPPYYAGILRGSAKAEYAEGLNERVIDYAVLSYSTPIAWHIAGVGWTYVARRFSASTDKSQSAVRSALHGTEYREIQPRLHLTDAQGHLLYNAHLGLVDSIKGGQLLSARKLEELGLVTINNREISITTKGKDYFA